jgi:hypothetical protein
MITVKWHHDQTKEGIARRRTVRSAFKRRANEVTVGSKLNGGSLCTILNRAARIRACLKKIIYRPDAPPDLGDG